MAAAALTISMTIFDQISVRIIKEQELIIGPLAWEEAKKVPGLKVVDHKKLRLLLMVTQGKLPIN